MGNGHASRDHTAAESAGDEHADPAVEPLAEGVPGPEHFFIKEEAVPTEVEDGGVLLQILSISADPYLRGGIKPGRGKAAGDAMSGFVAGIVLESKNAQWESLQISE